MKGLLIKNFKLYLKQNIIFIFLIILFIFITKSNMMGIVFLYNIILTININTNDEFTKWNHIEKYMPLKPKDIVLSKYLFTYILNLSEIILIIISYLLNNCIFGKSLSLYNAAETLSLSLIMTALIIPLIIFFGVAKARIVLAILIGILTSLSFVFISAVNNVSDIFKITQNNYVLIAVPITLILNILSILLSIKIYKSRRYKI